MKGSCQTTVEISATGAAAACLTVQNVWPGLQSVMGQAYLRSALIFCDFIHVNKRFNVLLSQVVGKGSATVFGTGSVASRAMQPPFTANSAAL